MRITLSFIFALGFLLTQAWVVTAKEEALPVKSEASEQPAIKSIASDLNKDGKPDRWEYYDKTILVRVEADSNFDGKIDEKAIVENGKITKVEKDSDYDGKTDKWVDY